MKKGMKLKLRKLGLRDIFSFIKATKNPEVSKNLQYSTKNYLLRALKEIFIKKDTYKFAILVNNKFAGGIVLEHPDKSKKIFEIGYFVAREYWGKGIATKAVKEILQFGRNNLNLSKVWAGTDMNNPASGKVLKKVGFKIKKKDNNKKEIIWEYDFENTFE